MIVNERLVTYLDSLTWQIPEPMQELEQWALQKEVPIIRRSMQSLLLFMLRLRQPKHVLEIGTAVGFSALLMRSESGENSGCQRKFCQISTGRQDQIVRGRCGRYTCGTGARAETI